MKIGVFTIVKCENRYLDEWVDHYLNKIGVDQIFIYDNNDIDGEVIKNFGPKVAKVDYRGIASPVKQMAYEHCYKNFKNFFDWIAFFDADEFLEIPETNNNIHEWLALDKFKDATQVTVNWQVYDDNNLLYYEDKPVQERFTHMSLDGNCDINRHVKSILKVGAKNSIFLYRDPHSWDVAGNMLIRNSKGDKVKLDSFDDNYKENWNYAYLKHYWSKSTEEYILTKMLRGRDDVAENTYDRKNVYYEVAHNIQTREKEEVFKKYGKG